MGNVVRKSIPCYRRRKKAAGRAKRSREDNCPTFVEADSGQARSSEHHCVHECPCGHVYNNEDIYSSIDEELDHTTGAYANIGNNNIDDDIYLNSGDLLPKTASSLPGQEQDLNNGSNDKEANYANSVRLEKEPSRGSTVNSIFVRPLPTPPACSQVSQPSVLPDDAAYADGAACQEHGDVLTAAKGRSLGDAIKLELLVSSTSSTSLSQRLRLHAVHRQIKRKDSTCATNPGDLRRKSLSRIPKETLSKPQSIKTLDLAYNVGIDISKDITRFTLLTSLSLRDCWLSEFPFDVLCLVKLIHLDLSNTYACLETKNASESTCLLPGRDVPARRRIIKRLLLRKDAGIPSLPSDIGRLSQLEEFYISGNIRLSCLPSSMEELRRLKKLDLSWCGFTQLPNVCESFAAMENMRMCGNDFHDNLQLRENSSMGNLKTIDLSECGILSISDIAKFAPTLECLHAGGNEQLSTVPKDIDALRMLKKLDLEYCNFWEIPDIIGVLSNLEELNMGGNPKVSHIPVSLAGLKSLRRLNLSSCCLHELPSDFGDLALLEDLNISLNAQLSTLPPSMERLCNLKKLRLHGCAFSVLPEVLGILTSLQFLDVSNNRLRAYPQVTLRLKRLNHLDLSNKRGRVGFNRIKQIPLEILGSSLQCLELENNPVIFPPVEICNMGINGIRNYVTDLMTDGYICADTITVIGEPGSGKSSIVRSLAAKRSCLEEEKNSHQEVEQQYVAVDKKHWIRTKCFSGHRNAQLLVPVFSPNDGLTLIVYNMSKDPESEFEKKMHAAAGFDDVRKWIISTMMRCSRPRIIVVGTHADKVTKPQKESLERIMKEHVSELIKDIKKECKEYATEMQLYSEITRVRNKKNLYSTTEKNLAIDVVTLSCTLENDIGIRLLERAISDKVRKSRRMPKFWGLVASKVMVQKSKVHADAPYLTLEEIAEVFQDHANSSRCMEESSLTCFIKHLNDTSQVIWIEEHGLLSKYVFHQPHAILNVCNKVLSHLGQPNVKNNFEHIRYTSYRQKCTPDGYISDGLLHHLSELPFCTMDVVIELMKHFHIINEVFKGPAGRLFVNLSTLPDDPPESLIKAAEIPFAPRIDVKLVFMDSIMPRAFASASLMTILEWVHSQNEEPIIWRNGTFFKICGVHVLIRQSCGFMEFSASSSLVEDNLWTVLIPVLSVMNSSVAEHIRGTPPLAKVTCAGCRCCGRRALLSASKERDHTTVKCLMQPTHRHAYPTRFCSDCKKDVPRCLIFPFQQDLYTEEDQKAVAKFYSELRQSCRCSPETSRAVITSNSDVNGFSLQNAENSFNAVEDTSNRKLMAASTLDAPTFGAAKIDAANVDPYGEYSDIVKKIRKAGPYLIEKLSIADVKSILDVLHSDFIIGRGLEEEIKAAISQGKESDAVRCLLSAVEKHGHEAAVTFVEVLKSECVLMRHLADYIESVNCQ